MQPLTRRLMTEATFQTKAEQLDARQAAYEARVQSLETLGGLEPGDVSDATVAGVLGNPESLTGAQAAQLLAQATTTALNTGHAVALELSKGSAPFPTAPLTTLTYDGSGQITHSSVVFRPQGWGGHRYWLAATPYPSADNTLENPSIWHSEDGKTWTPIPGNPIDPWPGVTGTYNSDTHLVFGPDDTLYCFWRANMANAVGGAQGEQILYRSSRDGLTWSDPVITLVNDVNLSRPCSPAIVYLDGTWHMWAVDIRKTTGRVELRTAADPSGPWSAPTACTIAPALPTGRDEWHLDVQTYGGRLYMLLNDQNVNTSGGAGDLYLAESLDGITWTRAEAPVVKRNGTTSAGSVSSWYRSAFLPAVRNGVFGFDLWLCSIGEQRRLYHTFSRFDVAAQTLQSTRRAELATAVTGLEPYVVADHFNRATLGTAPTLQPWTADTGTFKLTNGKAAASAAVNTRAFIDAGLSDYELRVLGTITYGTGAQLWLCFRVIDGSNYLRFGLAGNTWKLDRVTSGAVTTLGGGTFAYGSNTSLGDTMLFSVRAQGGTVTGYVNGQQLGQATETQGQDSTRVGIQSAMTAVLFDDLTVARI